MYHYVPWAEVKPCHKFCMEYLTELQKRLKEDCNVRSNINLVGSASSRLVTQNEKQPFDLDYNLIITNLPNEFEEDLRKLKDQVRVLMDQIVKETNEKNVSFGQDSTSSITYNVRDELGLDENDHIHFSFDLALIYHPGCDGNNSRLIHNNKDTGNFAWEEIRHSNYLGKKALRIKKNGKWSLLRDVYLKKKNDNLRSQDPKSSYILYIEAVNEVCQKS